MRLLNQGKSKEERKIKQITGYHGCCFSWVMFWFVLRSFVAVVGGKHNVDHGNPCTKLFVSVPCINNDSLILTGDTVFVLIRVTVHTCFCNIHWSININTNARYYIQWQLYNVIQSDNIILVFTTFTTSVILARNIASFEQHTKTKANEHKHT